MSRARLVVAPNTVARGLGFATELRVGWHKGGERVWWFGSTKNEDSLARLLDDIRSKHGDVEVIRRETDQ